MKDIFQRWFGVDPPKLKANRKLSAILVCLLVSLTFWFLISLSKDYSTRIVMPVVYQNFPGKKVVMNKLPATLTLSLRTSGFTILSYGFGKEKEPLIVDVSSLLTTAGKQDLDGTVMLSSSELSNEINRQLGSTLSINAISPDSLTFNFGSRASRSVPVHVNAIITFERQYDSLGMYSVMPHEVEITGPASVLADIRYIETDSVLVTKAKSDIHMKLKLRTPPYVECAIPEVQFSVPVEKFTEGSVEIPVRAANVRGDLSLRTFPDKVRVRFLVPLSKYSLVKPGQFDVMVNAAEISSASGSKLRVDVTASPDYVRSVVVEPEHVEYILRKK